MEKHTRYRYKSQFLGLTGSSGVGTSGPHHGAAGRPAWNLAPSTLQQEAYTLSQRGLRPDPCVPKPTALSFRVWLLWRLRDGHEKGPCQGLWSLRILAGSHDCKLRRT